MGLLLAVLFIAVVTLAVLLYLLAGSTRELRDAHIKLAAEVGAVRRDNIAAMEAYHRDIVDSFNHGIASASESTLAVTRALNERLVLLEIEKTAAPKPAEETPPPRRSFASQKARAEAGARK